MNTMSLKRKLALYKKHLSNESKPSIDSHKLGFNSTPEKQDSSINDENKINERLQEVSQHLNSDTRLFENQMIFTKETVYPLDFKHGKYTFSELREVLQLWQHYDVEHPLSTSNRIPSDLLFFDTETTGLGSGVGHMIFLLGCARYQDDGIHVKQYFLPGPGHEVALYHYFLNDVGRLKNLVTFNGKAFDWPKVKTRHTIIRNMVPKLPAFGHYDLLHASRRLWKNTLPSTSLGTVEEEILDIPRTNDVPGHMAPFLYFQFQKNPHAELVKGIFEHNEKDILTLITLYIHLSKIILKPEIASLKEKVEIAKWYVYLKQDVKAITLFNDLIDGSEAIHIYSKKQLVKLYKRAKEYHLAKNIIHILLEEDRIQDVDTFIEAAKLYEHQFKDYNYALYLSNKAYDLLEQGKLRGRNVKDEQLAVLKRIKRLKGKGNN